MNSAPFFLDASLIRDLDSSIGSAGHGQFVPDTPGDAFQSAQRLRIDTLRHFASSRIAVTSVAAFCLARRLSSGTTRSTADAVPPRTNHGGPPSRRPRTTAIASPSMAAAQGKNCRIEIAHEYSLQQFVEVVGRGSMFLSSPLR
jgi:hypothetical protein